MNDIVFGLTAFDIINLLFIAAGIGICGLCFLQITASVHLRREIRRYFQAFFLLILVYISTHLVRQLMDGLPGGGVRITLYTVTFLEVLAAGFMAHMISMLVLTASKVDKAQKPLTIALFVLLCIHAALLIVGAFRNLIYYFDAANVYHRGSGYILSNLCPLAMLVIDVVLLIRHGHNMDRRVCSAFWVYLIAPIAAIVVQSAFYGIQLIIFATVGAAVYMFSAIVQYENEQYEKQQKENSRIETELTMASSIQANMLPNIFPAFPERPEFDIYASMDPAKEVGGDFYDFFLVDDDHLCLVIADVSGKGVPAALFMMMSKTMIKDYALTQGSTSEIFTAVNALLCENNEAGMFATAWIGILDTRTMTLQYTNAGHNYPMLQRKDQPCEEIHKNHGLFLGGMEFTQYKQAEIQLEPGDRLLLFTDGVVEAHNRNDELYGNGRLQKVMDGARDLPGKQVLKRVFDDVCEFATGVPQFDDITMVILTIK